jgi:ABC-2 type transport system ATP-binding protein
MAVVVTDQLCKDFRVGFWRPRPHRAIDALSFEVPGGGVFGLLGPNGAGKTTTLKLLVNLLWPTSGRAEVLGRPPGDLSARRRLGFLPENPTFYDQLTADELLGYFAGLFGYAGEERRRRADRALDTAGLSPSDRRRPLRQYSKGMIQRAGLAQALVNDPELIVLDEPMSGLDPIGRREVREVILRLRDEGRTVIFSSHILSDAELLCSRVGILAKGRLVASGTVSELTAGEGRGWDIAVENLSAEAAGRLQPRVARLTTIAAGRYHIELGRGQRPEPLVAELAASGASLVSVTALRTTLEDVFMKALGSDAGPGPRAQGPGDEARS